MGNSLTQHVTLPTRGANIIDLILSIDPMVVPMVTTSDHFNFLDKASGHSALKCTISLS